MDTGAGLDLILFLVSDINGVDHLQPQLTLDVPFLGDSEYFQRLSTGLYAFGRIRSRFWVYDCHRLADRPIGGLFYERFTK